MKKVTAENRRDETSVCGPVADGFAVEEVFGGALVRAADHGFEAGALLARYQTQTTARRTCQNCPEGVFGLAQFASLIEHEERTRLHLLRDPDFQKVQLGYHRPPLFVTVVSRSRPALAVPMLCSVLSRAADFPPRSGLQRNFELHQLWCKG